MTEELKTTEYYTWEWAYSCPYCDHEQGWCNEIPDDAYDEPCTCDECGKEFKLIKGEKK